MTWWRDFFDEDALWLFGPTLPPERTEAEVAGAVRLLRLREGMRVVDLGCGAGRHAVALARRGLRVAGVEWSPAALKVARRRAGELSVPGFAIRGDLRNLPIRSGSCDAALSLFSTLGYEHDDETVLLLAEARRALKPEGRLLVEVVGRDAAVRAFTTRREWYEVDGRPVRVDRRIDPVAGEERAEFHFERGGGGAFKMKPFRRRLYTATELAALLRRAGFVDVAFRGDYEGAPLQLDSPHLLAVARA